MVKELTYKNFRDEIENISPNYYVTYKKSGFVSVSYLGNNVPLIRVGLKDMYDIDVIDRNFIGIEEIYQVASVLASTPINDRGDIEDINDWGLRRINYGTSRFK